MRRQPDEAFLEPRREIAWQERKFVIEGEEARRHRPDTCHSGVPAAAPSCRAFGTCTCRFRAAARASHSPDRGDAERLASHSNRRQHLPGPYLPAPCANPRPARIKFVLHRTQGRFGMLGAPLAHPARDRFGDAMPGLFVDCAAHTGTSSAERKLPPLDH